PSLRDACTDLLELGARPDEHQPDVGPDVPHRVDGEGLPFEGVEAAGEQDVITPTLARLTTEQALGEVGAMVEDLAPYPEGSLEATLHVLGVGEDPLGLAERQTVGCDHEVADRPSIGSLRQIAEPGMTPQLIRGSLLVDEPDDLAWMVDQVCGELHRDHHVDRHTVGFAKIEAAPQAHLMDELRRGSPLERDRRDLGLVPGLTQGADEPARVRLGAPRHERRLGMAPEDPQQDLLAISA